MRATEVFGNSPAGAGEGLSDSLVATEAGESHGEDELADDIGEATKGSLGPYERADGFGVGVFSKLLFPTEDGVCGEAEE